MPVKKPMKSSAGSSALKSSINSEKMLPAGRSLKDVFEQTVGIDRRDRTKGYGYPARESGRFGSHPMHDGFDDESGPD
jgi:hypothetical protein